MLLLVLCNKREADRKSIEIVGNKGMRAERLVVTNDRVDQMGCERASEE